MIFVKKMWCKCRQAVNSVINGDSSPIEQKCGELWSTNKKVIGVHVPDVVHAKNPRHSVVRFRVKCVGDGPGQTASYLQQNTRQTYHDVWTCAPSTRVCSRARGSSSGSQHPYRCLTSTYVDPPAGDRRRAYCSCRLGYGR